MVDELNFAKYIKTEKGYVKKEHAWPGTGALANVFNTEINEASGCYSHAEGRSTTASGYYSHAEGDGTTASNDSSHAEGYYTKASGDNSHAEGYHTTASGYDSHAEGSYATASGQASHAEGGSTTASGKHSHAEGSYTKATVTNDSVSTTTTTNKGDYTHAEGYGTVAYGRCSHAEGNGTKASGYDSHAEGNKTTASGSYSHAEGRQTTASGVHSHAEGYYTTALSYQHAIGHFNNTTTATAAAGISGTSDGTAFVIGNGIDTSASNAFRVTYNGETYAKAAYNSTGADYAEFFEWLDGNPDAEDRRGYFVTLDGEKIKIAGKDDYILGIISGQPSVIGNSDEDWMGRYIMDDFGAFIMEEFEYEDIESETAIDEETGEEKQVERTVIKVVTRYKENPNYDNSRAYIQRADRPEWDAVGMLGVLSVRDDGTCQVNGFCKVADGGIATASETGYRVIKRVNDHVIKVIFK